MWPFKDTTAAEWTQTATSLGLALCPVVRPFDAEHDAVPVIQGRLGPPVPGGHPDLCWISSQSRGVCFVAGGRTFIRTAANSSQSYSFTHWLAEIDPPLWMGLQGKMEKGGTLAHLFHTESPHLTAWDPARLNDLFAVRRGDGHDPYDLLFAACEMGLKVEVDDHTLRFERRGYALHPNTVGPPIESLLTIVERLKAAHLSLGSSPWELAAGAAWEAFAARSSGMAFRSGLAFDRERLRLHGILEGWAVDMRLVSEPKPRTVLRVPFPRPVGIALEISRGHVGGVMRFLGVQDIHVGDAPFDEAFVVRGKPTAMVKEVLHPEMRHALLELATHGFDVTVFDDRLEVSLPTRVLDVAVLDELLQRGMAVMRTFGHRSM